MHLMTNFRPCYRKHFLSLDSATGLPLDGRPEMVEFTHFPFELLQTMKTWEYATEKYLI